MAQETIKRRKRKRGSEMSMKELQQLEFLLRGELAFQFDDLAVQNAFNPVDGAVYLPNFTVAHGLLDNAGKRGVDGGGRPAGLGNQQIFGHTTLPFSLWLWMMRGFFLIVRDPPGANGTLVP